MNHRTDIIGPFHSRLYVMGEGISEDENFQHDEGTDRRVRCEMLSARNHQKVIGAAVLKRFSLAIACRPKVKLELSRGYGRWSSGEVKFMQGQGKLEMRLPVISYAKITFQVWNTDPLLVAYCRHHGHADMHSSHWLPISANRGTPFRCCIHLFLMPVS